MRIGRTIGDGYGDGDNVLRQIPSAQFLARFSRDSLFEGFAKYLAVRIADEQQVTADVVTVDSVPSLSILDGWWIEGCIEGRTGWAIDPGPVDNDRRTSPDAEALYDKARQGDHPALHQEPAGLYRSDVTRHRAEMAHSSTPSAWYWSIP